MMMMMMMMMMMTTMMTIRRRTKKRMMTIITSFCTPFGLVFHSAVWSSSPVRRDNCFRVFPLSIPLKFLVCMEGDEGRDGVREEWSNPVATRINSI